MSLYVKLSTQVVTDPKIVMAGPEGFTLWAKGLCYSCEHLTDGLIVEAVLPLIGVGLPDVKKVAEHLVSIGLWQRCEGGYCIGSEKWAKWQTTREQVERKREADRVRLAIARSQQSSSENVARESHASSERVASPEHRTQNTEHKSQNSGSLARFAPPTQQDVECYMTERKWIDPKGNSHRFVDHYTANGWMVGRSKMKDWKAAVRKWEEPDKIAPVQEEAKEADLPDSVKKVVAGRGW